MLSFTNNSLLMYLLSEVNIYFAILLCFVWNMMHCNTKKTQECITFFSFFNHCNSEHSKYMV